jgi:hypothetical protein
VHSVEEEKDSVKIYRPAESGEFPLRRFRSIVEFYEDGRFRYLYPDPADAHHFRSGSWESNRDESNIITIEYTSEKIIRIEIVELNEFIFRFISLDEDISHL